MLKSLELSGFKSFADRTRIDFSEGISALVGPNGSGKSNIVDAIKWVLGEQSVKKLRGGEMTDVIFNGSETRQASNVAEVTLTFDNTRRYLAVATPTVAVTRRVYRSGESEYLVNRQASRLKDIRELLSGTGLGLQAYSIIEQGRVELLLQSTSAQRRGVLEEAAGVARFNAKKQEVARRLDKVEQNLLRLSDIVSEVETQLRNTKSQAGKAQLYRQYSARLEELRTKLGLIEWRKKNDEAQALQAQVDSLAEQVSASEARQTASEAALTLQNAETESVEGKIRTIEARIASIREQIASAESTVDFQLAQIGPLEKEIAEHGRQLLVLNLRRGDTDELMRKTDEEIFEAKKTFRRAIELYDAGKKRLETLAAECEQLAGCAENLEKSIQDDSVARSRLEGEISGLVSRQSALVKSRDKLAHRLETLRTRLADMTAKEGELQGDAETFLARAALKEEEKNNLAAEKHRLHDVLADCRRATEERKRQLTGTDERISLLEDLLRKRDGLGPGVREILARAADPTGPFRDVHGLVADLIRVNVEAAPLIELALGADAEHVVVSPEPELFRYIEQNERSFAGQVSFIWPEKNPQNDFRQDKGIYDGLPGVVGRADRFVETDGVFEHLVWRLLGRTWIVETLQVAKELYRKSDGRTNFITLSGQALNANGTFVAGPASATGGWVTRRTELRTLLERKSELMTQVAERESQMELFSTKADETKRLLAQAEKDHRRLVSQLDELRLKQVSNRQRHDEIKGEFDRLDTELAEMAAEIDRIESERTAAEQTRDALLDAAKSAEIEQTRIESERANAFERHAAESKETTNLKIELAKSQERLDFLTDRKSRFEENQLERKKLLDDHHQRYHLLRNRRDAAELTVLAAESALAELYARKETACAERAEIQKERETILAAKKRIEQELKKIQLELAKNREAIHSRQLGVERLRQEQRTLAERLREDYGVDLAAAAKLAEHDSAKNGTNSADISDEADDADSEGAEIDPAEYRRQIDELRNKTQRLGNVNLEAIETLENLETRYTTFFNQYNDLTAARKSIQRIIERINVDSQRLFEETFDSVKIYFNDIFQKLFGGGHADIVFEDAEHPMESGIEIVVRPPGKDLKNVTLLSGGEKTLTCVAFLLAIFRHRAGPVCILDEVDAALDEGNIGRFTAVVEEFKTDTQFFIITHSKKTMMCAKSMYGVTMEDSGVSKLIAVEFDEVGENGEIRLRDGETGSPAGESNELNESDKPNESNESVA